MTELWKLRAEITVQPGDFVGGNTTGFINVVTWADSEEIAQTEVATYFKRFDWHIIVIEEATVLKEDFVSDSEEFQDMLHRARNNSEAIILGTFHSYKVN